MADRITLQAAPRVVLGKKVQNLRRDGRLPGNVYGRGIPSQAVDVDAREFARSIKTAGLRATIELRIDGEAAPRLVILRGMARKGGTGDYTHVDFFQVDPEKAIIVNVPVHLTGDAPAVRDLAGTLLPSLDVVSVRCLPLDIPNTITADVGVLTSFGISLTVGDLTMPPGVEILTDPSIVVATVKPPRIRGGGRS